ncbi:hypothetical protein pb186bvf_004854 [Paramecium bursaria]
MNSLMQNARSPQIQKQVSKVIFIHPHTPKQSPRLQSPPITNVPAALSTHSTLYQLRRDQHKIEKQKTEEPQSLINRIRSPFTEKNSVAQNYEIKKPTVEWDKENIFNKANSFEQRLSKDVWRRQGNMQKHENFLRKSKSKCLKTQIDKLFERTPGDISQQFEELEKIKYHYNL